MSMMFDPIQVVIDTYVEELGTNYIDTYGKRFPEFPKLIGFIGRLALENIANSDAPYHDTNHTIMVTDVGQAILKGKHISEGGVSPKTWLHFVTSLLCHDIGYVRGVCRGDADGNYVINEAGNTVTVKPGATDASMTPYHVNRSKYSCLSMNLILRRGCDRASDWFARRCGRSAGSWSGAGSAGCSARQNWRGSARHGSGRSCDRSR